jgi:hypothetical protein
MKVVKHTTQYLMCCFASGIENNVMIALWWKIDVLDVTPDRRLIFSASSRRAGYIAHY